MYLLVLFCPVLPLTSPPHPNTSHPNTVPFPYPEAGAVRVGPDEAEAIARNILAPYSKSYDGRGVPSHEVLRRRGGKTGV